MIPLGSHVIDRVSGFSGIAVSRHTYLHGVERITVQPKVTEDKKLPDAETFDEPQLIVISDDPYEINPTEQNQYPGCIGSAERKRMPYQR